MADIRNPYAPPAAAVADIIPGEGAVQPVKIFSARGRIGRLRYAAYLFGANLILGLGMWLFVLIMGIIAAVAVGASGGKSPEAMQSLAPTLGVVLSVIYLIFIVLSLTYYVLLGIRRSHDMNLRGWFVLLTFIPLVWFVWMLIPGTQGANRYGAPPPPNSSGVKVMFWIGMFFTVIGFLFIGILFVTAEYSYADYQRRAHQQQQSQIEHQK